MAGMPAIVVQYRAENVNLNNINIRGFSNAMADIKIFGGANRPKKVTISNVNIVESSKNIGIAGGGGVYDTKIIGGNLQGTGTGNAIEMYNNTAEIIGVNAENYNRAAMIQEKNISMFHLFIKVALQVVLQVVLQLRNVQQLWQQLVIVLQQVTVHGY